MFESVVEYLEEIKEQLLTPIDAFADDDEGEDTPVENEEDDEEEDDEDDEDEDDEEGKDPLDVLREEYKNTPEGQKLVHHYEECAARVQKAKEEPGYEELDYKEDCVEEFLHLQHYLDSHTSPRLFSKLK